MATMAIDMSWDRFWKALGSVELAIMLLLVMVVDLSVGFFVLQFGTNPFRFLNDAGLPEWTQTYGREDLRETLWFFLLLALLFLLAVNTFVCTTLRVASLWRGRAAFSSRVRFAMKLSPHVMHYALIVILLGYLSSYLFARVVPNNPLTVGRSVRMHPTEVSVRLANLEIDLSQDIRLDAWRNVMSHKQLRPVGLARLWLASVCCNLLGCQMAEKGEKGFVSIGGGAVNGLPDGLNEVTDGMGRMLILLCSSSLAGIVTAFAGPVAFVGLAVPHMARLCFGASDNRVLVPGTLFLGGLITSLCDLAARLVFSPVELPLSAITAFFGAPVVVGLLFKKGATL